MNPHYPLVAPRAAHHCEYCRAPEAVFNLAFEVEHIIPLRLGGPDESSNWALACRSCNLHKSDHTDASDPETRAMVKLFHPRTDRWADHFRVDVDTAFIVGTTATGRHRRSLANEHAGATVRPAAVDALAPVPAQLMA